MSTDVAQQSLFGDAPFEESVSQDNLKQASLFEKERGVYELKYEDKYKTKPGEIWQIGSHRLMCGDSMNPNHVAALNNSNRVDMVHSDPPYNVSMLPAGDWGDGENRGRKKADPNVAKDRKLEGDHISPIEFSRRLHWWFKNMELSLKPGGSFYIWGGFSNIANYPLAIASANMYWSQCIIWVKNMKVKTRLDFMGQHEICFYGWIPSKGREHVFDGPGNIPDVWYIDCVPRAKMVHMTEKPLQIPLNAIEYSSKPGDIILDLFGGSGSTLVAAEMLGRRARLMEIDVTYCEVILARCNHMGMEITKVGEFTGLTDEFMKDREIRFPEDKIRSSVDNGEFMCKR